MRTVRIDQVWSLLSQDMMRYEMRVLQVGKHRVIGVMPRSGKRVNVSRRALQRGLRGARLVQEADGSRPPPDLRALATGDRCLQPPRHVPPPRRSEPRGVARAGDRERRALALREAGVSTTEIARRLGVKLSTIGGWLTRAREARQEEANRRALG